MRLLGAWKCMGCARADRGHLRRACPHSPKAFTTSPGGRPRPRPGGRPPSGAEGPSTASRGRRFHVHRPASGGLASAPGAAPTSTLASKCGCPSRSDNTPRNYLSVDARRRGADSSRKPRGHQKGTGPDALPHRLRDDASFRRRLQNFETPRLAPGAACAVLRRRSLFTGLESRPKFDGWRAERGRRRQQRRCGGFGRRWWLHRERIGWRR